MPFCHFLLSLSFAALAEYLLTLKDVRVVLSARNEASLRAVAASLESSGVKEVLVLPLDLVALADDFSLAQAAVAKVSQRFGGGNGGVVDVLIHNGGCSQRGDVASTSFAVDAQIMKCNYLGAVALTKAVLPGMIARGTGGNIVAMSSVQGKLPIAFRTAYAASKHALNAFMHSMRYELAASHIGVHVICPGYVRTSLSLNALRGDGNAHGKMDESTARGYPPEYIASLTYAAVRLGTDEVVVADIVGRVAIMLQALAPALLTNIMLKRTAKERRKLQLEQEQEQQEQKPPAAAARPHPKSSATTNSSSSSGGSGASCPTSSSSSASSSSSSPAAGSPIARPSVYLPHAFDESRSDVLRELVRAHPLGLLITQASSTGEGEASDRPSSAPALCANPLPFLLDVDAATGKMTLKGHVARANPVWRDAVWGSSSTASRSGGCPSEALVVFQGPQLYVSPSLYATKETEEGRVVPTWNYATVQARGVLKVRDDPQWLLALLNRLTDANEAARQQPWAVADAPAEYVHSQLKHIVGIEIDVTTIVGKWKMSQNRCLADRQGVAAELDKMGEHELAKRITSCTNAKEE